MLHYDKKPSSHNLYFGVTFSEHNDFQWSAIVSSMAYAVSEGPRHRYLRPILDMCSQLYRNSTSWYLSGHSRYFGNWI